jgi:glutamate carboxypeptidase
LQGEWSWNHLNGPEDYTVPRTATEGSVELEPLPFSLSAIEAEQDDGQKDDERNAMTATKKARPDRAQTIGQTAWRERLRHFEKRQDEMAATIRQLVEIESPSDNKQAADRLGQLLCAKFEALGGRTHFYRNRQFGDHLRVDFPAGAGEPVLLLGHYDTVYPLGTLASMPCRIENGRLYGPGAFDMKSGIALMLHAIEAFQAGHGALPRPVKVLLVSDEEVGSESSRSITEALARECAAVLVLEPAAGLRGAVKTSRKGVAEYTLRVQGVSAHAGLEPTKGHSAILELAQQVIIIHQLIDLRRGLSMNVGVIQGGTRSNVIAAGASAMIDVRIQSAKQAARVERTLRSLKPFDQHCSLEISGGINRMPMERTAGVAALYEKAKSIASQIDWRLQEAAVGGGSDGNFTAALGIPTLDGMGGVGDGAHAVHEHIVISELPRRASLLAGMIENS